MSYFRFALLLALLLYSFTALSQIVVVGSGIKTVTPLTDALTTIVVRDSTTGEALVGATIRIISGNDTIQTTAQKQLYGNYIFSMLELNKRFRKPVELTVDYIGYKRFHTSYEADKFRGSINILMSEDPKSIAAIEVVGNRIAMIVRGDTTIYDAAVFKTMEGDKLGELLRQLPGVTVTAKGIFANGAEIQRVYIDGQRFFGDDTMLALSDMTAADVKSVKVYEEENPTAKRVGDKRAQKDKVMDVVTNSKPKVIRNIMVDLLAGASTDKEYNGKHELRSSQYFVCGINKPNVNYRLEGFNNVNDIVRGLRDYTRIPSSTPGRITDIQGEYSLRRGDSLSMNIGLGYAHNKREDHTITHTSYFPTEVYTLRQIDNVNGAARNMDQYDVSGNFMVGWKQSVIQGTFRAEYGTSQNSQFMNTIDRSDNNTSEQSQHTTVIGDNQSYSMYINYMAGLGKNSWLSADVRADIDNNSADGWRVDTTGTTAFRTILLNDGRGKRRDAAVNVNLSQYISKKSSIEAIYNMNYTYQTSKRLSVDYLNNPAGVVDAINTYDYTIDRMLNKLSIAYKYKGEKVIFISELMEVSQPSHVTNECLNIITYPTHSTRFLRR